MSLALCLLSPAVPSVVTRMLNTRLQQAVMSRN